MNPYSDILNVKKKELTSAQDSLHKAFIDLAKSYPYSHISVTELCKKANVARTTFYFSYPNTDAMLEEIEDGIISDLNTVAGAKAGKTIFEYISGVFSLVLEYRKPILLFLVIQPDNRFINKWKRAIKNDHYEGVIRKANPKNVGLVLEIMASMVIGGFSYYLEHPEEIDIRALSEALEETIETFSK